MSRQDGIHVDDRQFLLLKALYPDRSGSPEYYRLWREAACFDDLDGGSFRLVPMLWKRLAQHAERDELFDRIKGIYRYTLYKNSLTLSRFRTVARALHDAGVRLMLLKGAALLLRYHVDLGARPMNDVDVLLEKGDVERAMRVLRDLGWKCAEDIGVGRALSVYNSIPLTGGQGFEIDLHWRIMTEFGGKVSMRELWDASQDVDFQGTPVRVLSPEDQIMHTCAHGVKWNTLPPIRWIPDLMTIIEADRALIDWDRLLLRTRERNLTAAVRACLRFVHANFAADVPSFMLDGLAATRVSRKEVDRFLFRASPPRPDSLRGRVAKEWMLYDSRVETRNRFRKALYFPVYLRDKFGLRRIVQSIGHLLKAPCKSALSDRKNPQA
jgi:hypothetical protein